MNGKILNKEALKAWILSKMVTLTNNLLATTPGISAMDAAQGPVIQGQIDEINSNFGGCSFEQEGDDFYVTGADAVRKKLGSGGNYKISFKLSLGGNMRTNTGNQYAGASKTQTVSWIINDGMLSNGETHMSGTGPEVQISNFIGYSVHDTSSCSISDIKIEEL